MLSHKGTAASSPSLGRGSATSCTKIAESIPWNRSSKRLACSNRKLCLMLNLCWNSLQKLPSVPWFPGLIWPAAQSNQWDKAPEAAGSGRNWKLGAALPLEQTVPRTVQSLLSEAQHPACCTSSVLTSKVPQAAQQEAFPLLGAPWAPKPWDTAQTRVLSLPSDGGLSNSEARI